MEWISVKESLPPEDTDVLISDGLRCSVSEWDNSCGIWRGGNIIQYEVKCWMPLPKPPAFKRP